MRFLLQLSIASSLVCISTAFPAGNGDQILTLEQTSGRGERVSYAPKLPAWKWAEDGVHLVRGTGDDAVWIDPSTMKEVPQPKEAKEQEAPSGDTGRDARVQAFEALGELGDQAERVARRRRGVSEDGETSWHSQGSRLFGYHPETGVKDLGEHPGMELADLAPDGSSLAYIKDNDLIVVNLASGRRRALTSDGSEETFNGKLDWVYQEELYGRGNFKGFWWSPKGDRIAFLRLDERPVHEFTVIDHIEDGHFRVKPEITNYPKAGDPNPKVMLGIAEVSSGAITWVDLSAYEGTEPLVVRVSWDPQGRRVLYQVQNRIQNWLELVAADPTTGSSTTLLREESESWVEVEGLPEWLEDGSFLWRSARTGYRHLYRYRPNGELMHAVTEGPWRINRIADVNEEAGHVIFQGTEGGAVDVNTYRVGLDGKGFQRLTEGRGSHRISWNGDESLFLDRVSSLDSAGEVRLCDASGKVVKVLGEATVPAAKTHRMSTWELHEVPAKDGYGIDVSLLRPVPFDEKASYPVWIAIYSGPDAPSVRNRWNSSSWYQYLAQQGVIVMQVNVRSASGKGMWATSQCYRQFGVSELSDIEDTVTWITQEPWADAERVGITGYSFGGFMTAYALTHSKKFALGFAGGGVYDWGMYDSIYTERYMSTPQRNPDGYARTSVLAAAKNVSGRLVLHAGVMDDNVHVQNTLQLAYYLQKAGKDFDMMMYPQERHGVRNADLRWHLRQYEWKMIRDTLKPAGAPGAKTMPASMK